MFKYTINDIQIIGTWIYSIAVQEVKPSLEQYDYRLNMTYNNVNVHFFILNRKLFHDLKKPRLKIDIKLIFKVNLSF